MGLASPGYSGTAVEPAVETRRTKPQKPSAASNLRAVFNLGGLEYGVGPCNIQAWESFVSYLPVSAWLPCQASRRDVRGDLFHAKELFHLGGVFGRMFVKRILIREGAWCACLARVIDTPKLALITF
jgi:hypothetical protein